MEKIADIDPELTGFGMEPDGMGDSDAVDGQDDERGLMEEARTSTPLLGVLRERIDVIRKSSRSGPNVPQRAS